MDGCKVLLTTSGVGSRLGKLTEYTNKSLITVGGKAVLSHIIESYPPETHFVITLGHFGDHVKDYIELAHPYTKVTFVTVDNFSGPGSSLLYSMFQAKSELQCPFIYHCCDTMVPGTKPFRDTNWLAGSKPTYDASQYRTLQTSDDDKTVTAMLEKGVLEYDAVYLGLVGIHDWEMFWNLAEFWYDKTCGQSDCTVIMKMLDCVDFDFIYYREWYDMGNEQSLKATRANFPSEHDVLDKVDESIHFVGDSVIKFFANETMVKNRVRRALVELDGLVPEVTIVRPNFYKYKKVSGTVFSEIATEPLFSKFLDWASRNLWTKAQTLDGFRNKCWEFYYGKTLERVEKFTKKTGIEDCEGFINGYWVPSAKYLVCSIPDEILCTDQANRFHGDLVLDNVLFDGSKFTLIDWRQDFAGSTVHGDVHYDLAKLSHNLTVNHRMVSIMNYSVFTDKKNEILVDILRKDSMVQMERILEKFVVDQGMDPVKHRLLVPLIWLSMCPLHEAPLDKFLYYFGRLRLHKEIQTYVAT